MAQADFDTMSIASNWSFGTEHDGNINRLFSARNPRITSELYYPSQMGSDMTPFNSVGIMNEWNNAGQSVEEEFPVGGLQSESLQGVEYGAEAFETGEAVAGSAVPGLGEILIANAMVAQGFQSSYDNELSSARNFGNTAFRYGPGANMNAAAFDAKATEDVSEEKSVMAISSMFGPPGTAVGALINAFSGSAGSSANLNTTYSTSGAMVNGTSPEVADTNIG